MYGTIARMQIKPGMEEQLLAFDRSEQNIGIPGFVGDYVYRMDADPNLYYLVVLFESKEAYVANANSPEQHARYQEMRAMLASDPEWHDGEIVSSFRTG